MLVQFPSISWRAGPLTRIHNPYKAAPPTLSPWLECVGRVSSDILFYYNIQAGKNKKSQIYPLKVMIQQIELSPTVKYGDNSTGVQHKTTPRFKFAVLNGIPPTKDHDKAV